ncbi:Arm DNA-binding domain-containing protein [Acetivibrio saccincola]|jgi:hypothetical protein|uniref:AP2-like integrase N-terminal domain-containing protein n=1 Tax=Acetivibrio saccincola TaxID=1677857 RepID=A0A2K9E9Y4_9FIRM|nr:hypothetical protein [Acetivibrio saccincola]AUG56845.1 hypothetical protein HVS_04530 [Acetivibrio saccincola]AUG56874.1 hypothetical protein HVS_04685 [Acetivibrio saccincola]
MRRSKGEGSLTYIKRLKKYQVRYDVSIDENGKRIQKASYFSKKKDAIAFMQDELSALNRGKYVSLSNESLYSYCKKWYELYKEPTLTKINTKEKYKYTLNRIKGLSVGSVRLMDLSSEILQRAYNKMKADIFSLNSFGTTLVFSYTASTLYGSERGSISRS